MEIFRVDDKPRDLTLRGHTGTQTRRRWMWQWVTKTNEIGCDFAKAFNLIHWEFLLETLHAFGSGERWRNIIFLMLSTALSRVLLNGEPGRPFLHKRGVRQGDPLAPMFFILTLEPLHQIFLKATRDGLLSDISQHADRMHASFYDDDTAIFLNPVKEEVNTVFQLLDFFGKVSGLAVNLNKCMVYPVQCGQLDLPELMSSCGCNLGSLPCSYLGLPLSFRNP